MIEKLKGWWESSKDSPWWGIFTLLFFLDPWYDFMQIKDMAHSDILAYTDMFFMWHQAMAHVPLFLIIYTCFVKRWTWRGIGIMSLLVMLATQNAVVDLRLHMVLQDFGLYPSIIRAADGSTNANYAKISLYVIFLPFFFLRFLQKEYRTMDRYLTLLMAVAVIVTTYVFHWGYVNRAYEQIKDREFVHMSQILVLPKDAFIENCENSNWKCWIGLPELGSLNAVTPLIRQHMEMLKDNEMCQEGKSPCWTMSGLFFGLNGFAPTPVAEAKVNGEYRFVLDDTFLQYHFLELRRNFTTLGTIAGNVWVFGIILLWAFHQRAFRKRKEKFAALVGKVNGGNNETNV